MDRKKMIGMPYVFLSKNKAFKKNLLSFLVKKKRIEKKKNVKKKKENSWYRKRHLQNQLKKHCERFYKTHANRIESLSERKNHFQKKEKERIGFFLKKRLLWFKKKWHACLSKKKWNQYFQRFRLYRYLYRHYTEARLYESVALGRISLGEILRLSFFPIKPMHFEFCYRRCEGVLLCSPQKWYNLALLEPATL